MSLQFTNIEQAFQEMMRTHPSMNPDVAYIAKEAFMAGVCVPCTLLQEALQEGGNDGLRARLEELNQEADRIIQERIDLKSRLAAIRENTADNG